MKQSLLTTRQKLFAFFVGQLQSVSDFFSRSRNANFAFGCNFKDGQHQRLVVRDSHSLCAYQQ